MQHYFKVIILRDSGSGLTIVISPLLALMNNQLESADRFNLVARTINSNNKEEWNIVSEEILANKVDLLFISPERLANTSGTGGSD